MQATPTSTKLRFATLDVFTRTRYEGNPLAVVLVPPESASALVPSDRQLQLVAREFNLSETVFVYLTGGEDSHATATTSSSSSAASLADGHGHGGGGGRGRNAGPEWRIRIFLTTAEVPFAGHPTIGAAIYAFSTLAPGARKIGLLCPAGRIELDLDRTSERVNAAIPHNVHLHGEDPPTPDDVFGLQPSLKGHVELSGRICVVSPVRGMNFLAVELPDLTALGLVTPNGNKIELKLDAEWNVGFSASLFYVRTGPGKVRTRMIEGQMEDPATGSAACGLAAMLALDDRGQGQGQVQGGAFELSVTQGVEMGRRSEIGVRVVLDEDGRAVDRIELSGAAVKVMEGEIVV